MWLLREISLPHVTRHAARTALTLVGITLGVASVVATLSASQAVLRAFRRTVEATAGRAEFQLTNGGVGVGEELVEGARSVPGVAAAAALVEGFVQLAGDEAATLAVFGIDILADTEHEVQLPRTAVEIPDELLFTTQLDSVALSRSFAAAHGYGLGSRLDVRTPAGLRRLVVRGLLEPIGPATLFGGAVGLMDLPAAQRLLGKEGRVDRIDVRVAWGGDGAEARRQLEARARGQATVEDTVTHGGRAEDLLYAVRVMLAMSAMLSVVVGFFIIYHTVTVSIAQRRPEIALLNAVGVSRAGLLGWLLAEAALLGTVAAGAGLLLGFFLARAAVRPFSAAATAWVQVHPEAISLTASTGVTAVGVGLATAIAAALAPAWAIASRPLIRSLAGSRSSAQVGSTLFRVTVAAMAGFGATAAVIALSPRALPYAPMVTYAAAITCLPLVSCALLSPLVAVAVGRLIEAAAARARGLSFLLAGSRLTRNPVAPAAVVAAIVTGVAFTLVNASVVRSFERSFLGWLDEYYQSDLVVGAGATTVALLNSPAVNEDVVREIGALPGVREVQGVRVVETPFRGRPAVVQALDRSERPLALLDGDWAQVAERLWEGRGVVVSDNLATKHSIRRGDTVEVATPGGLRELLVLGVFTDYGGGDFGSITVSRGLYRVLWRDELVNRIRIWTDPGADPRPIGAAIEARYRDTHALRALTAAEFRTAARDLYVNNVITIVYALVVIALAISSLGVVNFLLAALLDRRAEIRVLGAIGVPHWRVAGAVVAESGLVGAVGAVVGVTAGAVVSRIIVTNAVVVTTGWHFRYEFPVETALVVGVATVLVTAATGLLPARVALRPRFLAAERAE